MTQDSPPLWPPSNPHPEAKRVYSSHDQNLINAPKGKRAKISQAFHGPLTPWLSKPAARSGAPRSRRPTLNLAWKKYRLEENVRRLRGDAAVGVRKFRVAARRSWRAENRRYSREKHSTRTGTVTVAVDEAFSMRDPLSR